MITQETRSKANTFVCKRDNDHPNSVEFPIDFKGY